LRMLKSLDKAAAAFLLARPGDCGTVKKLMLGELGSAC
jgi:hypothetical protein